MAVNFIGGGNQSTQRKPLTCRKSLTKKNGHEEHLSIAFHTKQCQFDYSCSSWYTGISQALKNKL
jgi:hypothetical protein